MESMERERLSKVLAAAGVASRRACEELIFKGKVSINGSVALEPQLRVDPNLDDIRVDELRIHGSQEKVYYLLNKPRNYVCSNKPLGKKRLVIDLFPKDKRLFTVGRLDRDTTGLLIVTNDGHFAQSVIHPRANIEKEYLVKTTQEIAPEHLKRIAEGGFVEGVYVRPVSVKKVRRGTLKIIVKEGKKREVRAFVKKAGLDIMSLMRIRIGGLLLGKLQEGEYREMTAREKEAIIAPLSTPINQKIQPH